MKNHVDTAAACKSIELVHGTASIGITFENQHVSYGRAEENSPHVIDKRNGGLGSITSGLGGSELLHTGLGSTIARQDLVEVGCTSLEAGDGNIVKELRACFCTSVEFVYSFV